MTQTSFPNISTSIFGTQKILKKYNIDLPNGFVFSDVNVIVGSNGSGKTRFLHAVRELYNNDGQNKVMYGYFPNLSASKQSIVKNSDLPLCTLYESLQESEVEFDDFLKEIELHNEEYIPQLLTYHSRLQKARGEKALKTLQDTYRTISGQEILLANGMVCLKDKDKKTMPLKDAIIRFSPGELMIFYMSVFLSLQKNSNQKRVIILDEPECHLHPKALIDFIRLIKESNYFTSIWIATHSLFLLPDFDFQNIIYIDNSKISPRSSRVYKDIFTNMLGENIERTTHFMASLSQWQYCEYIAECFTNPDVIDTINPNDEQVQLFVKFIENQKILRVLDFGGGSARLGLSLKQTNNKNAKQIIYEIYDPSPKYKGKEFQVYKSIDAIKNKYDCIVMMNVLHEIAPKEWEKVFKDIYNLLTEEGYLLFVETAALNKGEMPNKTGFLVLDIEELKILFSISQNIQRLIIKDGQKSVCVPVPKKYISNITNMSIRNAIDSLEKRTFESLKKEREIAKFETSRHYAFLTQLYINAKLFNDSASAFLDKRTSVRHDNKTNVGYFSNIPQKISSAKLATELDLCVEKVVITKENVQAYEMIKRGLQKLRKNDDISKIEIQETWKAILTMEKNRESKYTIALFLFCLYVMGDERCKNRIANNGYEEYVKKILINILKNISK